MHDARSPNRVPTTKRSASRSGRPGGILWLLKWLVVLALVVLLILAVIPADTAFAETSCNSGDAVSRMMFAVGGIV